MLKIEYTIFIILQYTIKMSIQDALIKFEYKEPTVDLRCIDNRSDFFLAKSEFQYLSCRVELVSYTHVFCTGFGYVVQ